MAITQIFATRNTTQTQVHWHIGKKGGLQAAGGKAGVCAAMTVLWIQKSKAAGPAGLTDRIQLGSQHNIAICYGAHDLRAIGGAFASRSANRRAIIENSGLEISAHEHGVGCLPFTLAMKLSQIPEYAYLGIAGDGGGHALGVRIHAAGCDFFDPNYGLYRCDGKIEFRLFVQELLENVYPDLLNGEWDLFAIA